MFKRQKIHPNMTDTFIGEGTLLEGSVRSKAGLRVDGQVQGEIECEGDVTIGKNGQVLANIKARNIIISGEVTGNIIAKEAVSIHSTGSLHGDLTCMTISIEEGGVFSGNSTMQIKPASNKQAGSPPSERSLSNNNQKEAATG